MPTRAPTYGPSYSTTWLEIKVLNNQNDSIRRKVGKKTTRTIYLVLQMVMKCIREVRCNIVVSFRLQVT